MSIRAVGLLGGTFNPIHSGHLALARRALEECRLDQVIFLPAARPPHKSGELLAPFADRIAMVRLAIDGEKRFQCSDIEATLPGPSYTIETLRLVEKGIAFSSRLYFLIGSDAFVDLLSWREYEEILRRVTIIVACRPGQDKDGSAFHEFLARLGYGLQGGVWRRSGVSREIVVLSGDFVDISSTAIREGIAQGLEPLGQVPRQVLAYIEKRGLYRADAGAATHQS